METDCKKSFDKNGYRCKTCGSFAYCEGKVLNERVYNVDENHHPCPHCGKKMDYDPGDGCVHEPEWYCDNAGCHYNNRAMATAMLVVAMSMKKDGKSEKEILAEIDRMKNETIH